MTHDLSGLMASQDQAEQMIGRFLATYVERARDPNWLDDYPVDGPPVLLQIHAGAALGSGGPARDVAAVAVRDPHQPSQAWNIDVAKGDMLTFDISGLWSPTCALRDTTLVAPGVTAGFADPTHLKVGPEGFSISLSNGSFVGHEHQSTDFSTETDQFSICGSISAALSAGVGSGGPSLVGHVSATGTYCRAWQTGHSESDSTSSGTQTKYAAEFAGGLRIPKTPFPVFPGGALLLVEVVQRPEGAVVREVHVLRPHASILFPDEARVYLVVNDKAGCGVVDASELTIRYAHAQSSVPAAQELAKAMANVLSLLREKRQRYAAQGSVSAADLAELRGQANDKLEESCHCVLGNFPAEVRTMFDAWLAAELASLERQVRITAANRSLDSLVLRLDALRSDLEGAADSSRLLTLMTSWELSDPAFQGVLSAAGSSVHPELCSHAALVLEQGNAEMWPIMRLLYPQALAALRAPPATEIEALRAFDWTLPYDEQIQLLEQLADMLGQRLQGAMQTGGLASAPVVVAFPRPRAVGTALPPLANNAVIAAPERLTGVWEPCANDSTRYCLKRRPVLTVAPEDVYGQPLVGLGCREIAPVVHTFAVLAGNNGDIGNDDWNANPRRADIFHSTDGVFPLEAELLSFRMEGALAPSRVRILASEHSNVWRTFDQFERPANNLQGVTPFSSFAVDLGDYATDDRFPVANSDVLYVVLDLQTRASTTSLTSVGVCAHPVGLDGGPATDGLEAGQVVRAAAQGAVTGGAQ